MQTRSAQVCVCIHLCHECKQLTARFEEDKHEAPPPARTHASFGRAQTTTRRALQSVWKLRSLVNAAQQVPGDPS